MKTLQTNAQLLMLSHNKKSVVIKRSDGTTYRTPAAILISMQFKYVATLIREGRVFTYTPKVKTPFCYVSKK